MTVLNNLACTDFGSLNVLNVCLNLLFVLLCDMTVDGVALATIISQYVSATLVIIIMMKQTGAAKFSFKRLALDLPILKNIIKVGLPAGIQSSLFALSNVVVTRAFNTFSTSTIHARTVVQSVDGIVSTLITSYVRSNLALTAQNFGARDLSRVKKVFWYSIIQVTVISIVVAQIMLLFCVPIASLFIGDNNENIEEILTIAKGFFNILLNTYFLCGIMDVLSSSLRGIKYSVTTMLISLFCAIPLRIIWVFFVFPYEPFNTPNWLMANFPISWVIAAIAFAIMLPIAWHRLDKEFNLKEETIKEAENV